MTQFKLKDLLNFLPIAVAIAEDSECRCVTVNSAMAKSMANYYSEEIQEYASFLSSPLYKVFHMRSEITSPDDLPLRRAVLKGEVVDGYEMDLVRPNGTVVTLMAFAMPWRQAGKVTGGIAAYIDMTDLRKARAEIELLRDHLHELKTLRA